MHLLHTFHNDHCFLRTIEYQTLLHYLINI